MNCNACRKRLDGGALVSVASGGDIQNSHARPLTFFTAKPVGHLANLLSLKSDQRTSSLPFRADRRRFIVAREISREILSRWVPWPSL